MQRLRERCQDGTSRIHADLPGVDYTLCGYAEEGTCTEGEGDSGVERVERGKINCPDCLAIIRHSKAIKARHLAAEH